MRVMHTKSTGPGAELILQQQDVPVPGPGQLLIRMQAAGVNFADGLMLEGRYQATPTPPFTPGMEIAGEIAALGADVTGFEVNDRVAAMCGSGGFAEYVLVPVDCAVLLPDDVSYEAAAALLVSYGTAEIALSHRALLQRGEWLVVTGAAGSTGLTAVETGALLGARVIAIARGAEKCALAQKKGAELTIDTEELADLNGALKARLLEMTGEGGVHVAYDTVGGELFKGCFRALGFEGRILPIGFAGGEVPQIAANHALVKNITVIGFWWGAYFAHAPHVMQASLKRIIGWASEGRIIPHIGARFALEEANQAIAYMRARKAQGKVLLVP